MPALPSPRFGLHTAMRLWPLVLAVWLAAWVLALPISLVTGQAHERATASLPADDSLLGHGDLALIEQETVDQDLSIVESLMLPWLAAWWSWTVLWHAGVVRWMVWASSRPLRLGELLGLGLSSWWRYLRLSLTATAASGTALAVIWIPLTLWGVFAVASPSERFIVTAATIGVAVSLPILLSCWAATLNGAWLLAEPGRRSAALAWCRGLLLSVRHPLASLAAMAAWGGPMLVAAALPLTLGWLVPPLRHGVDAFILTQLAGLAQAASAVTLFVSFAPVCGVLPVDPPARPVTPGRR